NGHAWVDRLPQTLHYCNVAAGAQPSAVTMLYATVRATAETSAAYGRLDQRHVEGWRRVAEAIRQQIPDLCQRYPRSTALQPPTPDWRDNPKAGLISVVRLLASALEASRS